jgi:uncharacterized membrane protein SirB2
MFANNVITYIQYDDTNVEDTGIIQGQYLNTLDLVAKTWFSVRRGKYIPDGTPTPVEWDPIQVNVVIQNEITEQRATWLSVKALLFDLYNVLGMAAPSHKFIMQTAQQLADIQAVIDYLEAYVP